MKIVIVATITPIDLIWPLRDMRRSSESIATPAKCLTWMPHSRKTVARPR